MRKNSIIAVFMALPALTGLTLFVAVPFLIAVFLSFTNLRLGSPLPTEWVGHQQFVRILSDESVLRAILNNVVFAVSVVPIQTALALGLALLANQRLRGVTLFRTAFFMPVVFPMSLVAVVWSLIYAPGVDGALNGLLHQMTLGAWAAKDFLHDPALALPAIILMSIWQGVGLQMLILLAGIQSIPDHLYEAASIDGATAWKQFWHVTLPQLRNTLITTVFITTILAFRLFDQIYILTQGGPNNATTTIMFEAVTSTFRRQQVARGAAITVVFFLMVLGITMVQRRLSQEVVDA